MLEQNRELGELRLILEERLDDVLFQGESYMEVEKYVPTFLENEDTKITKTRLL